MKYAVGIFLDQTYGFLTDDEGGYTTVHREAKLWDNEDDALDVGVKDPLFIEVLAISDVDEFQSRPDTW